MLRTAALCLAMLAAPVQAQNVELELVLLADASGSINMEETRFQRRSYAAAITDTEVLAAIANTDHGRLDVTYAEWAATDTHAVVVPWTVIDGQTAAVDCAEALMPPPRRPFGRSAIGSALLFGKELIESNEFEGWRKVIDFSGDTPITGTARPSPRRGRRCWPPASPSTDSQCCVDSAAASPARTCRALRGADHRRPWRLRRDRRRSPDLAEAVKRKLILEISGTMPHGKLDYARH